MRAVTRAEVSKRPRADCFKLYHQIDPDAVARVNDNEKRKDRNDDTE